MQGFGAVAVLNLAIMSGNVAGVRKWFLQNKTISQPLSTEDQTGHCIQSCLHVSVLVKNFRTCIECVQCLGCR